MEREASVLFWGLALGHYRKDGCFDVKITRMVHEFGHANKEVFYHNRFGDKCSAKVDW